MNARTLQRCWIIGMTILLIAGVAWPSLAQSGGGYELAWSTIAGGGGTSDGSGYSLAGTIGQAAAGELSGGGYTLNGGFWNAAGLAVNQFVYLPLILR